MERVNMGRRRTLIERLASMLAEDESLDVSIGEFPDSDDQWIHIDPARKDFNKGHHISHVLGFTKKGQKLKDVRVYKTNYDIHEDSNIIK